MKKTLLLLVAVVGAVALWTLPATGATRATTVAVTAGKPVEFRFTLSKKTVPKGKVTFSVTNKGSLPHDFRIAGKRTPLLQPGKSTKLVITFKRAGKFPYLCTVPGHAAAGMKGTLTVK